MVVDFVLEDGILYVSVANLGTTSAHAVRCKFDRAFRGLDGAADIARLALFRRLAFLPPGKEIRAFVDRAAAYFGRNEPTELSVEVQWRDGAGRRYTATIRHDLAIYRDLAYLRTG